MSGVPQGFVLGPSLFVNNLQNLLQGDALLLADDVKLISARANYDDLQQDFQIAWDCASSWDIPLNTNKCGQTYIGAAPTRPSTLPQNGDCIKLLDATIDLGVPFDNTFKTSVHCAQASKTARPVLFLIMQSFLT